MASGNFVRLFFMDKTIVKKAKEKLEALQAELSENLDKFADKSAHIKGDYKARFPEYGRGEDENAQEIAGYETRLSIEHKMELDLLKVQEALEKIEKGEYGSCEKCGQEIDQKRLEVYPEAELCLKCLQKERG